VRIRLGLALTAVVAVAPASAQSVPEDVVRAFFKAEDEGRWLDAARMLDLKPFERIRRNEIFGLRARRSFPHQTPEELMKWDPDMPRAVAEYQVERMQKSFQEFDPLADQFARVSSVDSLEALSTEEAAARWLEAQGPKWKEELASRESQRHNKVDCPDLPDSAKRRLMEEQYRSPTATILGATAGSDSVRYVVISRSFGFPSRHAEIESYPPLTALMLRNVGGQWKIIPVSGMPQSNGMSGATSFAIVCARGPISSANQKK
jgi:hypothetical protein